MSDLINSPSLPKHIAIVMDGNGRWAGRRNLPRIAGHKAGADAVHRTIKFFGEAGVKVLTLFAFSAENWGRPQEEVQALMQLFIHTLREQTDVLAYKGVRLRVAGDASQFSEELQHEITMAEQKTAANQGMTLVIAANYSGRWDITQATKRIAQEVADGTLSVQNIDQNRIQQYLSLADLPEPDLFIRTSGEIRISNFLLWQIAYSELYFTEVLWPDFDEVQCQKALDFYATRERRFGLTQEQISETTQC